MNLKWLHDELAQILKESFCITLEVWNHQDGTGSVLVTIKIWDGHHHFFGPTPEVALALVRAAHETSSASGIPEEVVVP